MIRIVVGIGLLQFASMLLLLVRTKVVALALGTSGVGQIASFDALTAVITQTLSMSLPYAAIRFLPAEVHRSRDDAAALYGRMRLVLLALLTPATIVCVALALVHPAIFGAALVPYRRTLVLALVGLPVVGLVPFHTNAFAALVGHTQSMMVTIAHAGVMVFAALIAAAGTGVDGFYASYALLGLVLVIVASRRLAGAGVPAPVRHRAPLRGRLRLPPAVWRFGAWLLPLTFLTPYAAWFLRYDTLRLFGVPAAGLLQSAVGVSLVIRALLGAAHVVFLTPNVNRVSDPDSRMRLADEFAHVTCLLFVLALPPLLLFADVVLRLLYARQFSAAYPFVVLFVAAEALTILSGTFQALIVAADRMRFHVLQNLFAQALLVAIAAIAIPRLGLAGAGFAALAAPVFLACSTLWFLHRSYGLHLSPGTARVAAGTLALLVIAGLLGRSYPGITLPVIAAKAAVCVALWVGAIGVLPPSDRARLRGAAERALSALRVRQSQWRDVG
jgi:O-antigen/teichoic acid export membrane protein